MLNAVLGCDPDGVAIMSDMVMAEASKKGPVLSPVISPDAGPNCVRNHNSGRQGRH